VQFFDRAKKPTPGMAHDDLAADDAAPDTIRLESAGLSLASIIRIGLMRSTVANLAYPTLRDLRVLKETPLT
jgi:hypothetical protein